MTYLETTLQNLEEWEWRLTQFLLRQKLSSQMIEEMAEDCAADPRMFADTAQHMYGVQKSVANAIQALAGLKAVRKGVDSPPYAESVPVQQAARLAWLSFFAGLNAGMCGAGVYAEQVEHEADEVKKENEELRPRAAHGGLFVGGKGGRRAPLAKAIIERLQIDVNQSSTSVLNKLKKIGKTPGASIRSVRLDDKKIYYIVGEKEYDITVERFRTKVSELKKKLKEELKKKNNDSR